MANKLIIASVKSLNKAAAMMEKAATILDAICGDGPAPKVRKPRKPRAPKVATEKPVPAKRGRPAKAEKPNPLLGDA
jgi:hypothetical protein